MKFVYESIYDDEDRLLKEAVADDKNVETYETFDSYRKAVAKAIKDIFTLEDSIHSNSSIMWSKNQLKKVDDEPEHFFHFGKKDSSIHGDARSVNKPKMGNIGTHRRKLTFYQLMSQLQGNATKHYRNMDIQFKTSPPDVLHVVARRIDNHFTTYIYVPVNSLHTKTLAEFGERISKLVLKTELQDYWTLNRIKTTPFVDYTEKSNPNLEESKKDKAKKNQILEEFVPFHKLTESEIEEASTMSEDYYGDGATTKASAKTDKDFSVQYNDGVDCYSVIGHPSSHEYSRDNPEEEAKRKARQLTRKKDLQHHQLEAYKPFRKKTSDEYEDEAFMDDAETEDEDAKAYASQFKDFDEKYRNLKKKGM